MFAWFTGFRLKLVEYGGAALAAILAFLAIEHRGAKQARAEDEAASARATSDAVKTAEDVRASEQAKPDNVVGIDLKKKYSRGDT